MQQLYQKIFKMQVGTECFYREYVFINSFQIRCASELITGVEKEFQMELKRLKEFHGSHQTLCNARKKIP